jgi:predicted amidohydrolase YtcJ
VEEAKVHGQDQVKKLPVTVQNEGLMYNPVNMKIEDEKRLYERDLREKNKKARYEVRYDVDAITRKEGLAEQDRQDALRINKISGLRFEEETTRGYDILNNAKLEGAATSIKMDQVNKSKPIVAWNKVLHNANANDKIEEQIKKLEEEEYYKRLKQ